MLHPEREVPVGRTLALADRRRLVASVLGVGAALGLILLLQGLWTGLLLQASAYADHSQAGFVRQTGTRGLIEGAVPADAAAAVARAVWVTSLPPDSSPRRRPRRSCCSCYP